MDNEKLVLDWMQAVKDRQFFHFGNIVDVDYNWYDFIKFLVTHPYQSDINWTDEKKRVFFRGAHMRPSLPKFAKELYADLKITFHKNDITLIPFAGFTDDHKSLEIHNDGMDVLYLQVLGEINWSFWEPTEDVTYIMQPHQGKMIWQEKLTPGDLVWIPRGVWHHVEPLSPRVGFSFGVEGTPDPSTYV